MSYIIPGDASRSLGKVGPGDAVCSLDWVAVDAGRQLWHSAERTDDSEDRPEITSLSVAGALSR